MGLLNLLVDVVTLPISVASDALDVVTGGDADATVEKAKDIVDDIGDTLL